MQRKLLLGSACGHCSRCRDELESLRKAGKLDKISTQKNKMTPTFISKQGHVIYVKENGVGGRSYYSDEIGGGVMVWDTALVDIETLEKVIEYEKEK